MKKYFKFFRASFQIALQYKFDFFMWVIFSLVQICLYFFLWRAIFEHQSVIHGYTLNGMLTYIVLSNIVQTLQPIWHWGEIAHLVSSGDIIFDLVKPYNFLVRFYFGEMGARFFSVLLTGGPFLLISFLLLHVSGPASVGYLLLTVLSLVFSTLISYAIWTFVGLTSFYLTRVWGVFTMIDGLYLFLSGNLIPLDFMPGWLQHFVAALPFKDITYTPISIYLGRVPMAQIPATIATQALWAVILLALLQLYYRHGLKKIVVQGG